MEMAEKAKILKGLNTKELIDKLHKYEDELQDTMNKQMEFVAISHSLIASRGSDCQEVKRILAELSIQAPEVSEAGKKLTAPDKENWLIRQRKENKELLGAITKQRETAFVLDDHQVRLEMAKKRLEGIRAVLALRTAQINFLASG